MPVDQQRRAEVALRIADYLDERLEIIVPVERIRELMKLPRCHLLEIDRASPCVPVNGQDDLVFTLYADETEDTLTIECLRRISILLHSKCHLGK